MNEALLNALDAIDPVDQHEVESIAATRERLTWDVDPFDETADPVHLTASAFVLSSRGVILHQHRRLGIWVQPGGHVDAGEDPADAALRETREETGLDVVHTAPPTLFHVDRHPGPRGHTHLDLRYVLLARPVDPSPPADESQEVYWFDFPNALLRCEPMLVPALTKLRDAVATWTLRD
jgi:8-oxo-dGTP pyrophosphatase MutT (NUDIX family)